jgi:selenocysteine-specific elongation factor
VDPEIRAALEMEAVDLVTAAAAMALAEVRTALAASLRRRATVARAAATAVAADVVGELITAGRLAREGDRIRPPGGAGGPPPELVAAMDRLEAALAVAAPPSLSDAARAAGCSLEGIRVLEAAGRIVRVEDDLAWAAPTLRRFEALAVRLATGGPLSPATFRDATGTSRRYALAILEDLDRRTVLRRTPAGHVPGPRAGTVPVSA